MADYSIQQLVQAARAAGFSGAGLVNAVAVSLAEDGAMTLRARGVNRDGTVDRGPWQFNSHWHPEVSDACAYDLNCSAQQAFRVSKQGADWGQWSTWINGSAKAKLQQAQDALGGAASAAPNPSSIPGLSLPDPTAGIGQAIQSVTTRAVAGGQIVAGGLLFLGGLVALVLLVKPRG